MKIIKILIVGVFLFLCFSPPSFAEKILLLRGKLVEGRIIERTSSWIKVDAEGNQITYLLKDVQSIDDEVLQPGQDESASSSPAAEVPASPGEHTKGLDAIKEVLELSGLKKQLEGMQSLLKTQLAQCADTNSVEVCGKVQEVMLESFTPQVFYQSALESLTANFNDEHIGHILEFVKTPLSKKLIELEIESQDPARLPEKRGYIEHLMDPAPERKKLIDRMETATNQAEMTLEIAVQMSQAIYQAVQAALKPEERSMPNPTPEQLDGFRTQIRPVIQASVFQTFLFNYRYASDEELEQYIQFLETDSGRWFTRIINQSTVQALDKIASIVAEKIFILEKEPPELDESQKAKVNAILDAVKKPQ